MTLVTQPLRALQYAFTVRIAHTFRTVFLYSFGANLPRLLIWSLAYTIAPTFQPHRSLIRTDMDLRLV